MSKENFSKQKISKEQLESIMKSNPEFAKRVVSGNAIKQASTNPTRIFSTFEEAQTVLGLARFNLVKPFAANEKPEDNKVTVPENCFDFGSGSLQLDGKLKNLIEYLTGKSMVSIALSGNNLDERSDIINLKKEPYAEIEYTEPVTPIRFCFATIADGKFKTIAHLDFADIPVVGKYRVTQFKLIDETNKNDPSKNFTIDISIDDNGKRMFFALNEESINTDTPLFIIPIAVTTAAIEQNEKYIEDKWNEKKDEFVSKLVEGYETLKEEITDYVKKCTENKGFSKALAVYAIEHNEVYAIQDAIETNVGAVDTLTISTAMFPRYGDEYIDLKEHDIAIDEELGLPIITDQDVNNLKIIGFDKDLTKQIVAAALESYTMTKQVIESNTEEQHTALTNESYDAECRLIVDLGTERWRKSLAENFGAIKEAKTHEKTIRNAEEHIESIKQQLASLQMTSRRVAAKVANGEFTNVFAQLCDTYLHDLYKTLIKDGLAKDSYNQYLEIINDRTEKNLDFVTTRINSSIKNTLALNFKNDKYGNKPISLYGLVESFAGDLFDADAIPDNIPEAEADKRIMDLIFNKYKFIDSLSRTPYKFAARLFPEVFNLDPSVNLEEAKKKAAEYAAELGIDIEEFKSLCSDLYNSVKDKLDGIRNCSVHMPSEEIDWNGVKDELNKVSVKFNNAKCSGPYSKAKLFAKYYILLNSYEYADSISTGLGRSSIDLNEVKALPETERAMYTIECDGKNYTVDAFEEMTKKDAEKVPTFVILKKLTDQEKVNIERDFLLRSALLSHFMISTSWCLSKYVDHCSTLLKDSHTKMTSEYGKMFVSELGIFVPCLSVLETGSEPTDVIPNDMKIKIGTDAVEAAIDGLKDKEERTASIRRYLVNSFKFIDVALAGLIKE